MSLRYAEDSFSNSPRINPHSYNLHYSINVYLTIGTFLYNIYLGKYAKAADTDPAGSFGDIDCLHTAQRDGQNRGKTMTTLSVVFQIIF